MPIAGRTSREIADSVEDAVESGALRPREPLPSVRALAQQLAVSPSTVAAAYRDLRMRGVVTSEAGRVTRVGSRPPVAGAAGSGPPSGFGEADNGGGLRDLSDGNPDPALLPDMRAVLGRLELSRYLYGAPTVVPELAEIAAEQFADLAHVGLDVGPVCVVGGAMDGVERVLATIARFGDRVVIEDPGHTGVLELVRAMGLEPIGVLVDHFGPDPEDLQRALEHRPVACVLTPRAQNPTGAALDNGRAAELRSVLAARPEVMVIENDHASAIAGVPYLTLCGDRRAWAVVRSTSKYLGPDLRLGFVAGDRRTVSRLTGRHQLGAGWVSHVLQHLMVCLWRDDATRRAVRRAADVYRQRRETVLERLAEHGVDAYGRSGFNVVVPVAQEAPVIQRMQSRGWALRAGEAHRIRSAAFVRITASTLEPDDSARLAADLAAAVAAHPSRLV